MKNKILKFESRTQTINGIEFEVPDYFSKKIHVKEFFDSMPDVEAFYVIKTLQDDDKLERVQFDYYEDVNYWDIILMINGMEGLLDIPTQEHILSQQQDKFSDYFFNEYYYRDIEEDREEELREIFKERILQRQSKFKYIKIVPQPMMSELIRRFKREGFI